MESEVVAAPGEQRGPGYAGVVPALTALAGFVAVRSLVLVTLLAAGEAEGRPGVHLLMKWDAQWYAGIAARGYGLLRTHEDGRVLADYAFFPMYPMTERMVSAVTGLDPAESGLVVSFAAALVAAAGIFVVADHVMGPRAAVFATILWAALPIGVVQTMAYSESLFTALAAWTLYAVLRERWLGAAVLACAAGLTRPGGVAVAAAVLVTVAASFVADARREHVPGHRSPLRRRVAALWLAPAGTLGYLGWVAWRVESPTGYLHVADGWGNGFDGGMAFGRWIGAHMVGGTPAAGLLVLAGMGMLALLLVLSFRQRQPLPLLVFVTLLVVLALGTSGYHGSKPRYLLPAFPLLFPLAHWLAARRTAVGVGILVATSVSAAAYGAVWLLGSGPP